MDIKDPRGLLESMAKGSFAKVIEQTEKTIYIETKTEKVKNEVLKNFVKQAKEDGNTAEDLIEVLLALDEAIENNNVRNTLMQYLNK